MGNILVLGGGGREHALGWAFAQSPKAGETFFAPGNAGTMAVGQNLFGFTPDLLGRPHDLARILRLHGIDLAVIGPDHYLQQGWSDALLAVGCPVFGSRKAVAKIEWSKVWGKEVLKFLSIPTPDYIVCHSIEGVWAAIRAMGTPCVLKVDGLAAGKGVIICRLEKDVTWAAHWAMEQIKADKGPILVEAFVPGTEASMIVFCDGRRFVLCPPVLDYKRRNAESDEMTGGMGCAAPAPIIDREYWERIAEQTVQPLLQHLCGVDGRGFHGGLFLNLMLTPTGPVVLECNARPGDPETQAIVSILKEDMLDLVRSCAAGRLEGRSGRLLVSHGYAVCVVAADESYPAVAKNMPVLPKFLPSQDNVHVFHANTTFSGERGLKAKLGRILSIVGVSERDHAEAGERAYGYLRSLALQHMAWREDIGKEIPHIL